LIFFFTGPTCQIFDAIPPKFELEEAIEEVLLEKGLLDNQKIHLEIFHEGEH